jgi:hypothetical protein
MTEGLNIGSPMGRLPTDDRSTTDPLGVEPQFARRIDLGPVVCWMKGVAVSSREPADQSWTPQCFPDSKRPAVCKPDFGALGLAVA